MRAEIQVVTFDVARAFFTDDMVFLQQHFHIRLPLVGVKLFDAAVGEFLEQVRATFVSASAIDEGCDLLALAVESIPRPALLLLFPDE